MQTSTFNPADYQLSWGDMAISESCGHFLQQVVIQFGIKNVLEFGTGISTLLLNQLEKTVVSYETNQEYMKDFQKFPTSHVTFKTWDGKSISETYTPFDLAFVDGPKSGENRFYSTKLAAANANIVIVHDAFRKNDFYNQAIHFVTNPHFKSVILGGASKIVDNRLHFYCYCWTPYEVNELPKALRLTYPVLTPSEVVSLHQ